MQRDNELIRKILLFVETIPPGSPQPAQIEGYDEEQVSYHVMLLNEAGYIKAVDYSHMTGFVWEPISLTWQGHEFLDAIRSNTIWEKTKAHVKAKGVPATVEILFAIAKKYATDLLLGP